MFHRFSFNDLGIDDNNNIKIQLFCCSHMFVINLINHSLPQILKAKHFSVPICKQIKGKFLVNDHMIINWLPSYFCQTGLG